MNGASEGEIEAATAALLDFSKEFDVGLFERIVKTVTDPHASNQNRLAASSVLTKLRDHPHSWYHVDKVLENAQSQDAQFMALEILQYTVKYRWAALGNQEREGVKQYIVTKCIQLSQTPESYNQYYMLLGRLNVVLVEILKHEWPHNWPSFIPEIVEASNSAETLCENNLNILKLLAEEIFEFSEDHLTSQKAQTLKASLKDQFSTVLNLAYNVLLHSQRESLRRTCLTALSRYIPWLSSDRLINDNTGCQLVQTLVGLTSAPQFRMHALECLGEVFALFGRDANQKKKNRTSKGSNDESGIPGVTETRLTQFVGEIYQGTMSKVLEAIPQQYMSCEQLISTFQNTGDSDAEGYIHQLALFLTTALGKHFNRLEGLVLNGNSQQSGFQSQALTGGHNLLATISDTEEDERFKTCLDYWLILATSLYTTKIRVRSSGDDPFSEPRLKLYEDVIVRLREILIQHMAKPEEVLLTTDDEGEVIREHSKDTSVVALHKQVRDVLKYLSYIDINGMENLMVKKLERQADGSEWGWDPLNKLCWSIGAVSGVMEESEEKQFLVTIIKYLLSLCEHKHGKDNKAIIASNIMYVVGQYPRFLRAHWKFLKTVILKLFEFMHEDHPGVKDMAVDTMLKIANKCQTQFITPQDSNQSIFVEDIIAELSSITEDLQSHQLQTFYEAVGTMIAAHPVASTQEQLTRDLMSTCNEDWRRRMAEASNNIGALRDQYSLRTLGRILRINTRVAAAVGPAFTKQLSIIFKDSLSIYKVVSAAMEEGLQSGGIQTLRSPGMRVMRALRVDVTNVVKTYIERCSARDKRMVVREFVPPLIEPVFQAYENAPAELKDYSAMDLFSTLVEVLGENLGTHTATIFRSIFRPTLPLITQNFEDNPDHRQSFYSMIATVSRKAFNIIAELSNEEFQLYVDAVVWGFKHTGRGAPDNALDSILTVVRHMNEPDSAAIAPMFFQYFCLTLLRDIFTVLTDRLHLSQMESQIEVIREIFLSLVVRRQMTAALWESSASQNAASAVGVGYPQMQGQGTDAIVDANIRFVHQYLVVLLGKSFPTVREDYVTAFVSGLFNAQLLDSPQEFERHIKDFLIQAMEITVDLRKLQEQQQQDQSNQNNATENGDAYDDL